MKNPQSSLPPGFRFHPTDEELILHYLRRKVTSAPLPVSIIAEVDIYKFDPWDLPPMAAFGEKEWYFFSPRDRKYPNGARPNRAAASGYWKATGTDKVIVSSSPAHPHENLGVKKALVFYEGRPPKGVKTNWIMHEYRLAESPAYRAINHPVKPKDSSMRLDDWVLCRIYKKSSIMSPVASSTFTAAADHCEEEEEEEVLVQDDPLKTPTNIPSMQSGVNQGGLISQKSSSFSNLIDAWDYSLLSSILSDPTLTLPINSTDPSSQSEHYPNVDIIKNNHGKQMFTNGTINSSSQSFTHHQKLPQLSSSSSPNRTQDTNNIRLKRQRPYDDDAYAVDPASVQPKRFLSQCSFVTNSTSGSGQLDFPQYSNAFNYPFLNQQLLLGPNCSGPFQR